MITGGAKQQELDNLETIGFVTTALFEVSAEKINRLRTAFEKNSKFYTEITKLYQAVKQTARARGELSEKTTGKAARDTNRSISVAFTTNSRFYGSVNTEVMRTFLKNMQDPQSDYLIIGRTGGLFMRNFPEHPAQVSYLLFKEDEPSDEEMRTFLDTIAPYEHVYVFHSSFVNVFTQKVSALDVAYMPSLEDSENTTEKIDYIFEPELPKILAFFETRVRHLLFQRIMLEAELARTAARLISMNQAQDRADSAVTRARRRMRRENATFNDARLLEAFSAITKWKK